MNLLLSLLRDVFFEFPATNSMNVHLYSSFPFFLLFLFLFKINLFTLDSTLSWWLFAPRLGTRQAPPLSPWASQTWEEGRAQEPRAGGGGPRPPSFPGRGPGQGPTADALEHSFCHRSLVTALDPDPVFLQVSGLHPAQVCSPGAVAPGPGRLTEAGPSDPTEDPRTGQRKPL